MTLDHAAQAAADCYDTEVGFVELPYDRDLYVRAFRQGYKYRETEQLEETKASWRALTGSDSPQDPRTASKD